MLKLYKPVIDELIETVNINEIYLQDLEKIHLFLIIWDSNRSSFNKRLFVRRLFDSAGVVFDTPYDIIVLTSEEFKTAIMKKDVLIIDIIKEGELLYKNKDVNRGVV